MNRDFQARAEVTDPEQFIYTPGISMFYGYIKLAFAITEELE